MAVDAGFSFGDTLSSIGTSISDGLGSIFGSNTVLPAIDASTAGVGVTDLADGGTGEGAASFIQPEEIGGSFFESMSPTGFVNTDTTGFEITSAAVPTAVPDTGVLGLGAVDGGAGSFMLADQGALGAAPTYGVDQANFGVDNFITGGNDIGNLQSDPAYALTNPALQDVAGTSGAATDTVVPPDKGGLGSLLSNANFKTGAALGLKGYQTYMAQKNADKAYELAKNADKRAAQSHNRNERNADKRESLNF